VNLFENNIGFQAPVISITKIEQIDSANEDAVLKELIPGVHYVLVRQEDRGKYTQADNDVIVIRGSEDITDPITGDSLDVSVPLFVGQRLKIYYITNPDIPLIQEYFDSDSNRDITKDVLLKTPNSVIVDVDIEFSGGITETDVRNILSEFIRKKGMGSELTVNEIVTVLAFFGVTDIKMPVTLRSRVETGSASFDFEESTDRLSIDDTQIFIPEDTLSVTKSG
jgi:hypothetical protein